MTDYTLFDPSNYLDSDEVVAEYLSACAEDENPDVLLAALADVAKARGMRQVAEAAGLGRESLYKTLKPGAHPRFETVQAVLRALGVKLSVSARAAEPTKYVADVRLTAVETEILRKTGERLSAMAGAEIPYLRSPIDDSRAGPVRGRSNKGKTTEPVGKAEPARKARPQTTLPRGR
jgi:probable addiction module antidote protein